MLGEKKWRFIREKTSLMGPGGLESAGLEERHVSRAGKDLVPSQGGSELPCQDLSGGCKSWPTLGRSGPTS